MRGRVQRRERRRRRRRGRRGEGERRQENHISHLITAYYLKISGYARPQNIQSCVKVIRLDAMKDRILESFLPRNSDWIIITTVFKETRVTNGGSIWSHPWISFPTGFHRNYKMIGTYASTHR